MRPRAAAPGGHRGAAEDVVGFSNDVGNKIRPAASPPQGRVQRATFSTSRLAEFCTVKELVTLTGTEPADWPLVVVREAVDNSLDSCEEAGIAPVIRVTVARGRIRVRDNGPGIPPETVAELLDFSTRTSSRAGWVSPSRGQQGNALGTLFAMGFALSGKHGRVEIEACGVRHEITFKVDQVAQQPVIEHQQSPGSVRIGTSITVWWPQSSWSELEAAGRHFLPILRRFADLNPHLSLCATWAHGEQRERWWCEAIDPGWTKWTPSAPTCPHWYRPADLERLAGAFMAHDRKHKSIRLLRDFLAQFNGLSGTGKRKEVLEALGLQRAPLERLLKDGANEFDHHLVSDLLEAMQAAARPIRPEKLGPLGRDNVEAALGCYETDSDTFRYKLIKGVDDGVPWIVEAGFAYRPEAAGRALLCGINWSAALADDPFRLGYQLGREYCGPNEPIVLLAHLICPRPSFLDRGKGAIARHSPGYEAVEAAVAQVSEAWAKQRRAEIRNSAREQNRLDKLRQQRVAVVSLKDMVREHLPRAIENVSHRGTISFTQRDLFYVLRPVVQSAHEKRFKYSYFKALLTDIENEQGEINGLQREPRGMLYHPHTHEEIPLSTKSVAAYRRPFFTFNKMVYSEKAGFQKNLIEVGWPEEFDCAIASSGGFTTRAVKDLVDLLATSTEPITVFCVHDADAAGTLIYETLQRETKARGARKIEIINVGLEPWEGIEMGLEVEAVERTEKRRPVAAYVVEHDEEWRPWLVARGCWSWADWLQRYRIELNAIAPLERIAWLTGKIKAHPPRKVIPPAGSLDVERINTARGAIFNALLEQAKLEERTEEILSKIEWPVPTARLPKIAARYLERLRFRSARWDRPMKKAGLKAAARILKTIKLDEPK